MSGVGSSPALATCETSQVLLAGVPDGFSRGSPVFAPPIISVSYELKSCADPEGGTGGPDPPWNLKILPKKR